ncbi:MAG: chromosomal replication initiator protein DnaA [Candidatus Wallbacteria bacterium]|nr:chromosomal replication initiator protein DnaA [Candidatus Wallbacteria bacterium]
MQKKWNTVLENLKGFTTEASFESYLKNMRLLNREGNTVFIGVYNDFIEKRIKEKYQDLILEIIRAIPEWSNVEELKIKVSEEFDSEIDDGKDFEESKLPDLKTSDDQILNPKYTFENFIGGSSNEMALAAALAVAEDLGKAYNPLFIYGGVGLGKTHLMKAIAHRTLKKNNSARVIYTSAEQFTNELIASIMNNWISDFHVKYRSVDVLLIDDIQFLVGKERTQEEFFHTFNELYDRDKQIVISSDRPPGLIQKLEDRLVSRFESGMIADIKSPDLELRVAILKNEAVQKGISIDNDAVIYLSKKIVSNIRKLEGAFIRVCAFASLNKMRVTPGLIDDVLRDMLATNQKKIIIEDIQRAVASYFKIKLSDMKTKNRSQNIAFPRQIAMYLSREFTSESLPAIGREFGGRDHTTVMHACKRISNMLKTDLEFKAELDNIIRLIDG